MSLDRSPDLRTEDALAAALRARDEYLAAHPSMVAFQQEIDDLLDRAGPREGRFAVIAFLLQAKLEELREGLGAFRDAVEALSAS